MGFFKKAKATFDSSKSTKTVAKSVKLVRDSGPKVSLDKIQASGVSLVKSAEAANKSLQNSGLLGIRADAIVLLDHSGSMGTDYSNGSVQTLVEKALAYGLQFDDEMEIIPFDSVVRPDVKVNLSNYANVVNERIYNRSNMGTTNLTDALKKVLERAKNTSQPIYCMVITDGNPNNKTSCSQVVCQLAGYAVFIKFLALGNEITYLQELDDLGPEHRLIDNVDAKFFADIKSITDQDFAEAMADEWSDWMTAAQTAGILTN